MALCRAPTPRADDQNSAASPSPAMTSQRHVFEMCICDLLPEPFETTGPTPQFKLKNDLNANGIPVVGPFGTVAPLSMFARICYNFA